ncbi:hypothetical protein TanjilG_20218 [Lupinus angustifolius]|uniref:Vacuolar protein sorting-associated protein 62 n=2 Tax=Lupinus angustifolius TaxID=3871 RepID=A0A1J7HFY0_LUPAN|nr:hypothetical protein TanjilG_20218 [Lupinus angustifolius]
MFNLPAPTPTWPLASGGSFASGIIDLGGLQVSQISTFNKVWATHEGGPDNQGATVFEPTAIPEGFYMLGSYSQPNNKAQFGWVLVAKDVSSNTTNPTLKQPIDYTLVWNTESLNINEEGHAYVWLPTAPNGYKAVGHVVTTTPDKPSLDKIRCVREDLTDQSEQYSLIWSNNGFFIYDVRPSNRGTRAPGIRVGTFVAQTIETTSSLSIACLKNTNANKTSSMPNLQQIDAIMKVYSPFLFLHPDEEFYPSSVNWFFSNGALLYTKGQESKPVTIEPNGTNLPQGGENDGAYWIDLPTDGENKDRVSKGDLSSARSYVHVKPMFGSTFTDIAMWVFYPYNGPSRAKVKFIKTIKLGKIGEHVGDWEHVTLRVSNFNAQLWEVYFSQHNKGIWVEASQLEFQSGNKPVVYSSLHGHAAYPHAGLNLLGDDGNGIGIRDDTDNCGMVMDMGEFEVVSAEYLGSAVIEPAWLNYFMEWGPKFDFDELKNLEKILHGKLKRKFENILRGLPSEVLGEEGPTGPKCKNNWIGDEV